MQNYTSQSDTQKRLQILNKLLVCKLINHTAAVVIHDWKISRISRNSQFSAYGGDVYRTFFRKID